MRSDFLKTRDLRFSSSPVKFYNWFWLKTECHLSLNLVQTSISRSRELVDFSHECAKVLWSLRYDESSGSVYTRYVNDSKETRSILELYKYTVRSRLLLMHTPLTVSN